MNSKKLSFIYLCRHDIYPVERRTYRISEQSLRFFAHRWNFGRYCAAVYPTGYPAHYQSRRERFSTLPLSTMYHVFLSINAPPQNRFLARLTRHLEANDFPFPVKHSAAFPFDPPLSLSVHLHIHIFSQIVGSLWLETDRIDCLMASFPYVRRFIVKLLALPLSGDPTISFKIYFYTPRFEKRIQSPDDSDG